MFLRVCRRFGGLLIVPLLLSACSSTQVQSTWKDPYYQAVPQKVMVVGVTQRPASRRLFEDEFVWQLKALGIDAVASYTVVSDRKQNNQRAIARQVRRLGADAVLITRTVGYETVKTRVPGTVHVPPMPYPAAAGTPYQPPPFYNTWQDYYAYGYQTMYTPGYIAEDKYAIIETNLYQASNDKLVWAATSETSLGGSKKKSIKNYIKEMVKTMIESGLF